MKWLQICAILIAFLFTTSAYANHAPCPIQQTSVFFVNGVDVPKRLADNHKKALAKKVYAKGASRDCVHFELAHVKDFTLVLDIGEALLQKTRELSVHFETGLGMLFRSVVPDSWFDDDVIAPRYSSFGATNDDALFNQIPKHLALYEEKLATGHRVVLVSHSQGGFYTNAAYSLLTDSEKEQTRLVAVVTPAALVADGGPNTRLTEDLFALFAFPLALAANETNLEPCGDSSWFCHGFEESYLHGTNSRTRIVADIIALIPTAIETGEVSGIVTAEGYTAPIAGAFVIVCRMGEEQCDTVLGETTSGSDGRYFFSNLPECSPCRVQSDATIDGEAFYGRNDFNLPTGGSVTANIILEIVGFN
jgi:hypothetical protein